MPLVWFALLSMSLVICDYVDNEEIQTLVISLLPLKDAVRTSILSKNCRMLWTSYPNLCFDGTEEVGTDQGFVRLKSYNFFETVDLVIQQHSGIGLNKFGIRFPLWPKYYDYLDRWICFAIASKAKVIDIDLSSENEIDYHFALDALDAQGNSFVQSMRLSSGCIKPHPNIHGFTKLARLVLSCVEIFGDLSHLLLKCPFLNDFQFHDCFGVDNLSIPCQLDKLESLQISGEEVQMVECHGASLANFEYTGPVIPIALHGCSILEKASISVTHGENRLVHAFTEFPSILAVKILTVSASFGGYGDQVHTPTTRPQGMFMHLRHLTCEILIFYDVSNTHTGITQLLHCLDFALQLETLHLDMCCTNHLDHCWNNGEAIGEGGCHMHRHDHLRTVYMSGFRCYQAQVALACCILENSPVLEHMTIEPKVIHYNSQHNSNIPMQKIHEWAQHTSEHFGKGISVLAEAP